MGMNEARETFKKMGVLLNEGMILKDLSNEDIDKLRVWYESTRDGSIQMPTEKAFYENILLALSLFPQKENGKIKYVFGKGIGIEIALRGQISNRNKNEVEFPYRSHSDFEMYGMDGEYNKNFVHIFGAQEKYPTTKTKGLTNLPPDLIGNTAEQVNLDGIDVLIPQLEILFLDKYLKQESTPREQGIDAALLAKQYDLNYSLIYKYLLEYSMKPQIEENLQKETKDDVTIRKQVNRFLDECAENFNDDYDRYPNRNELCESINTKISQLNVSGKKTYKNGISLDVYKEFLPEDLIDMGTSRYGVSKSYVKDISNKLIREGVENVCDSRQAFRQLNTFCSKNGLHLIPEEKLQQLEDVLDQWIVNKLGKDYKELNNKGIEQILTESFEAKTVQDKGIIAH